MEVVKQRPAPTDSTTIRLNPAASSRSTTSAVANASPPDAPGSPCCGCTCQNSVRGLAFECDLPAKPSRERAGRIHGQDSQANASRGILVRELSYECAFPNARGSGDTDLLCPSREWKRGLQDGNCRGISTRYSAASAKNVDSSTTPPCSLTWSTVIRGKLHQALRPCFPHDIVNQICWAARYERKNPVIDHASVMRAVENYFLERVS